MMLIDRFKQCRCVLRKVFKVILSVYMSVYILGDLSVNICSLVGHKQAVPSDLDGCARVTFSFTTCHISRVDVTNVSRCNLLCLVIVHQGPMSCTHIQAMALKGASEVGGSVREHLYSGITVPAVNNTARSSLSDSGFWSPT